MPKRSYGDTLTGGSRDVNPQFLSFLVTESAVDTTTTITQALPVQRLPNGQRSQVMEILKVFIERPAIVASASVGETQDTYQLMLTTKSFGTTTIVDASEANVWAFDSFNNRSAFTAGGTYNVVGDRNQVKDLTDGAGHGILIATDNIFAQISSGSSGVAAKYSVKILYRMKNVSLFEFIGIVQSQQ